MKKVFVFSFLLFCMFISKFAAAQNISFEGNRRLIARCIPWLAGKVDFEFLPVNKSVDTFDIFSISTYNNRLQVKASSVSAGNMAVNYYLHHFCNQSFSLLSENIKPLAKLPVIRQPVIKVTPFQFRHGNYHCTHNYTQSFWQWEDWERCIDWYALNGVNLMLTLVGAEGVEQKVLRQFGYTEEEIFRILPGPAYTNWHWLGNLEGEGGPVTQNIIDKQVKLQQNILQRLKELGIEPIMQGFCALVPSDFNRHFPQARTVAQGEWGGHDRPHYLSTSDPLFTNYADAWYQATKELFGTHQYFSADLVHEGGLVNDINLPQAIPDIQHAMMRHNPKAVWVVQAWFIEADDYPQPRDSTINGNPYPPLLAAAIKEHIMVWDIYIESDNIWERRKGYNGLNFMMGTLTYFGARCGMVGKLDRYISQIQKARNLYPQQVKSAGTNPEAIDNNPVWYDFLYSQIWNIDNPKPTKEWLHSYAAYRYGKTNDAINRSWDLMHQTVYKSFNQTYEGAPVSIFSQSPDYLDKLNGKADGHDWFLAWSAFKPRFYDTDVFEEAAKTFISAKGINKKNEGYVFDLTDITRQLLSNRGNIIFDSLMQAYGRKDLVMYDDYARRFFICMDLMEKVCNTHPAFRVHTWLAKARSMGDTDEEKNLLEKNARTLITKWGHGNTPKALNDYSQRQWAGLLNDYYKVRWAAFLQKCRKEITGQHVPAIDFIPFADEWISSDKKYDDDPAGDIFQLSKQVAADKLMDFSKPYLAGGDKKN